MRSRRDIVLSLRTETSYDRMKTRAEVAEALPAVVLDVLAYLDAKDQRIEELERERDRYGKALEDIATNGYEHGEGWCCSTAKAALGGK